MSKLTDLYTGKHLTLKLYEDDDVRWEFIARNVDPQIVYVVAWRDKGGPNEGLVILRQFRYAI